MADVVSDVVRAVGRASAGAGLIVLAVLAVFAPRVLVVLTITAAVLALAGLMHGWGYQRGRARSRDELLYRRAKDIDEARQLAHENGPITATAGHRVEDWPPLPHPMFIDSREEER